MSFPAPIPDCSVGPGVADIVLTDIGGRNPIVIEAADLGPSWEINQPSTLTVDFALVDLIANYQPIDGIKGKWISWYGNGLGAWAGIVTAVQVDPFNGSAQVSCVDFSQYLNVRLLPAQSNLTVAGCAGGVADVLVKWGEMADTLFLASVDHDDVGDPVSVQISGQNLLQQLKQNADDTGQEFKVDENRNLTWRQQIGRDLTESVQLTEGVEIATYTPSWDTADVVNDLIISPSQANYQARYARRVEDDDSIAAIFRQQGRITTSDAIRPSAIASIGRRALKRSAALGRTISLDVINVNDCFLDFREGDTIRVILTALNMATDLRIVQRSYTLSDQVLMLVGEIPA